MTAHEPDEWLVYDGTEVCPYLPTEMARMPLRLPCHPLDGERLDAALAAGDRRTGGYLYRPQCPACKACQALRIDVRAFRPSRTQQRVLRKGDRTFQLQLGRPQVDDARLAIFNRHRQQRGLSSASISASDYSAFLVDTCCDTLELSLRLDGRLIAISILDRGQQSMSAVYCCFDPALAGYSPGTYAILKEIELSQQWNLRYLYLGLYIAANQHMCYKSRFRPHERLIEGKWVKIGDRIGWDAERS